MRLPRIRKGIVAALATIVCGCGGGSPPDPPLSLLLITVDTLRPDRLGCYGNEGARTPSIDALAVTGAIVAGAATSIPATIPSLSSLHSSSPPSKQGLFGNRDVLSPDATTLAETLRDAGYATEAIAYGIPSQGRGLEQGFLRFNGASPDEGTLPSVGFGDASEVAERFAGWIADPPAGPFFLWVHFWDPHQDYTPPAEYAALFGGRRDGYSKMAQFSDVFHGTVDLPPGEVANSLALYDGEIAYVDEKIGAILDAVDRAGLTGRTVVAFAADHGEDFYEHHRYIGHGRFLCESAIRIPMILAGPNVAPGGVVDGPVRIIDLAPTLLRLLGVERPAAFRGRSFAGSLSGGTVQSPGPVFSLLEDGSMMVRTDRWKLAVHRQTSTVELYDFASDPGERVNLEAVEDSTGKALEGELRKWALTFADKAAAPRKLPKEFEERLRALGYID